MPSFSTLNFQLVFRKQYSVPFEIQIVNHPQFKSKKFYLHIQVCHQIKEISENRGILCSIRVRFFEKLGKIRKVALHFSQEKYVSADPITLT